MEARIKKIFHRKRDDASEPSLDEDHSSEAGNTNSALRTSLYDLTVPQEPPQTGTLPFQGNSTRLSPQPVSSIPGGGPSLLSPRNPSHGSVESSTILGSGRNQQRLSAPVNQKGAARLPERSNERPTELPEIPVLPVSPSLNVVNEDSVRSPMQASQTQAKSKDDEERGPIRVDTSKEADDHLLRYTTRSSPANFDPSGRPPRKDPASRAGTSRSDHPSPLIGSSAYEPQSPTASQIPAKKAQHGAKAGAPSSNRPMARTTDTVDITKKILEKAQSNSAHTEVIETIAPAVVHETIHQQVHEIRQEFITREVHNHEYHHRILPIIDVEVLPARHFLPVEGGGLVEINRDEVPGRGRQWVIAETASKTRSDQPVPQAIKRFSARDFTGSEGEFKRHVTPGGFERTEQTWVHPPELEIGGRDTGQTWPQELGGEGNHNNQFGSRPVSPGRRQPEQPPINHTIAAERLSPV